MKIAIIGTGISGLTCAYLLNQKHDINIYEKNDYIGGHTHTHKIKENNLTHNIDSGFIVFNENTYPNFIKLLNILEVETEKTNMGFSVKSSKINLEYSGNSLNSMFAQKSNIFKLSFWKMLFDIIKFNKIATKHRKLLDPNVSLEKYLKENKFSSSFKNNYIYPMGAAIWSTRADRMREMSALFFINFFYNHGLLKIVNRDNWFVIKNGSNQYVKKIIKKFKSKIHLNCEIEAINRENNQIEIISKNRGSEFYDSVIIASHSDQALKMLSEPSQAEKEILGNISYQRNNALLHTDISVLPKRREAWSSWNYNLDQGPKNPMAMTYNMNILQNKNTDNTYCVTLNNDDLINKKLIIKNLRYSHPLLNQKATDSQKRKNEINGKNNTYFCGAYWRNGFHEDGVVSALDVCKYFGVGL